jgi:NitT/TauT family transport system substrate-binding protein
MHDRSAAPPEDPSRRTWMGAATACALGAPALLRAQPRRAHLRWLLNTGYSSPQAWLWLAQARGYLEQEGIELELTPGAGAYTAAPRMIDGGYDIAYGDVNSLIEEIARRPQAAPRGVYMMFNASPSCVAVRADGPLRHPRQFPGTRLVGHDTDVALRTFGALCLQQGIERAQVDVSSASSGMTGMVQDVLAASPQGPDGAFGYVSTFTGALTSADPALLPRVRFLTFAEFAPDLYGSVLMASRRLLREEPAVVTRLVRALNRGVADLLREPEAGLDALGLVAPGFDRRAEAARLKATLDLEMNHADGRRIGLGDVDEARLARSIALMARANQLPRVPALAEVFTRAHLPPQAERALRRDAVRS